MTKSMLFFIAVLIVALGARPVLAGDDRVYVGETSVPTAPNIGIVALHALCEADFKGARMCSSSDIIRNGVAVGAVLPATFAWLHPSLVAGSTVDFALDASGARGDVFGALSCNAFTSALPADVGLLLSDTGRIGGGDCLFNVPVACCRSSLTPSGVPSPPGGPPQ